MAIFVWEEHPIHLITTELRFSCVQLDISVFTPMHQTQDNLAQLTTTIQFKANLPVCPVLLVSLVKVQLSFSQLLVHWEVTVLPTIQMQVPL